MKLTRKLMSLVLLMVTVFAVVSCGEEEKPNAKKTYTRNIYTSVSPSNWNELTYQDNNDTAILSYISGSFFEYDFKFDEQGEIVDGQFEVEYSAATKIEDVTQEYVGEKWGIPATIENAKGETVPTAGRAYKVTLRDDIRWDDGTAVDASDFIYTMQEQLNPLFQNYRADSYYASSVVIHNAKAYVMQGQKGWFSATAAYGILPTEESILNSLIFSIDPYKYGDGEEEVVTSYMHDYVCNSIYGADSATIIGAFGSMGAAIRNAYGSYGCDFDFESLEGKTYAEIMADPTLKAQYDGWIEFWCTEPEEPTWTWVCEYEFPAVEWSEVGYFAPSKYELVLIMDKSVELLDEKGELTYHCGYDFGSLPLVKKSLYESCKIAPNETNTLWTTDYNTSVAKTASWGPYKLTTFQAGKFYKLEKNPYWYGWNMESNEGLYQTEVIACETIAEWNTAWVKFQAGELDGIGIDISIAQDYKNSERAYFTGDDFVGSLQLQSDAAALKNRETEGIDKEMLSYIEFRKALSVGFDRDSYNDKTSTSNKTGMGLFNEFHYYDVANGGVYRHSDVAKQVLVDVYAVDVTQYPSVDAAIAGLGGANLDEARELINTAYEKALAAGTISATDKVVLTYGTSVDNESTRRSFNTLNEQFKTIVVGTPLEGRFELEFDASFGKNWANDFRSGKYDICAGGWTGAAWDPGYFLMAYLDSQYRYATAWDTTKEMMTFTFQGEEHTMSLMDWWSCLNGNGGEYDWSSTYLAEEERLPLIAALEKQVLLSYYTLPYSNSFEASLISYKCEYITYTYNTFMAYGGIKYLTYNYDDAAWAAKVEAEGGTINYKN